MQASEPQPILTPPTTAAIFLVATIDVGGEAQVRELLSDLGGLRRSVGFRVLEAGLTCVAGIGAEAWERLFEIPKPAGLHPFRELNGDRHRAPSTPGDLLFHIRAERLDLCFELARLVAGRLDGCGRIVDEVHGFRSFDQRDLLGFVDGTENPEGDDARAATLVPGSDPAFANGSYVIVQKYTHDLDAWNRLPVEEQERAIGRTKLSDVEFPDDQKPLDSHLALNTIVDADGEERDILRLNMPFGHVGSREYGTYYIAYARDCDVIERMLTNMFIGNPPGNTDRILDFSTAVTGSLFFVPPVAFLEDPPADAAGNTRDGSLQIGSLKGKP